jgi:RHS repeat-associated protein
MTRTAQGTSSVIKQLRDDRGAAATIKTGTTREILYCRRDHKGSTTDFFGANGTIVESFSYSGYGQPHQLSGANAAGPRYEQRQWDDLVGLYYFGARYYDPVTGRFLTPDTQLGGTSLTQADVLNRFAFELNNPINNVDLTGHGLRDVLIGIGIGVALVAIGAAIILTGGAAAPLGAIAAGALVGAGLNAITYSATHTNQDAATFYKGFAVEVAVGAVVGGVTGAASLGVASVAETLSANAARQVAEGAGSRLTVFAIRAAVYVPAESAQGVASSTFNQFMLNVVDKEIGGEDISLDRSLDTAAATGAVTGAVKGVGKAGYGAATLPRHTEEEGLELRPFIAEQRTYGSVSSEPVDPGDLIRSRSMLFSLPVMFAAR